MADSHHIGKCWKCYNTPTDGPIGTKLGWSVVTSNQPLYRKTFSLVLVVTVNREVNVLVLWGVEIKNIHNFDELWMTLCYCYKKIW